MRLLNYHIEVNDYPSVKQLIKTYKNNLPELNFILNAIEPGQFGPPLWYAIGKGLHQIATLLVQWGAEVNWQAPSDFKTCLHVACENLDLKSVEILMNHGANPHLCLFNSKIVPYDLAKHATLGVIAHCMEDHDEHNEDNRSNQHQLIDNLFAIKTRLYPHYSYNSSLSSPFPSSQIENHP